MRVCVQLLTHTHTHTNHTKNKYSEDVFCIYYDMPNFFVFLLNHL